MLGRQVAGLAVLLLGPQGRQRRHPCRFHRPTLLCRHLTPFLMRQAAAAVLETGLIYQVEARQSAGRLPVFLLQLRRNYFHHLIRLTVERLRQEAQYKTKDL
jgi:hypothetical protein